MKKRVFVLEEYTNNRTDINFETYGYTHLRAFHACRPLRLEDYLKNGINPINYLQKQLQSLMTNGRNLMICTREYGCR